MSDPVRLAAVDLGATSGRVMAAEVGPDRLRLDEAHRFPNAPVRAEDGSLRWDIERLYAEALTGLRLAAAAGTLDGIGIDSWAVDYGLLDAGGLLLEDPYAYRDSRTDGVAERVLAQVDPAHMYGVTGLQQLPFTTIYQLVASAGTPPRAQASTLLLLPDLLAYWLTGRAGAERTNASTTGLYDVRSRTWATALAARVGVPADLLPPLRGAGEVIGPVLPSVDPVLAGTPVIAVGSHDTASAVAGTPLAASGAAYISSGTWSLVGLELDHPVLSEAARLEDFTNEAGVDGTIRFLKNVMGLWVLTECLPAWNEPLSELLDAATRAEPCRTVLDVNDPRLLAPAGSPTDMADRLVTLAAETGEPVPRSAAELTRCILDSLALAYRRCVRAAAELADQSVEVVHVVGGGSRNAALCQLTADACELPVLAGPAEATALGNILVQARALGAGLPDLSAMRALVRRTHHPRRFDPRPGVDWAAAASRLRPVPQPAGIPASAPAATPGDPA